MRIRTNPVRGAPSLVHAVALVDETPVKTEKLIRRLMKAFPPRLYELASQLVRAVLKGKSYDWAIQQAQVHRDEEQKKYALLVLPLLKSFLEANKPDWVRELKVDPFQIGVGLQLPVKVHSLMKVGNRVEVLVIHFWAKPISVKQKRAAITIIKNRLAAREELRHAHLRWIDLSAPAEEHTRRCEQLGWDTFPLMDNDELKVFTDTLFEGWQLYLLNPEPPRPKQPRKPDPNQRDLFPPEAPHTS